jgi:Dolichyl-phosphate-mannose-protein mannosyltransferase
MGSEAPRGGLAEVVQPTLLPLGGWKERATHLPAPPPADPGSHRGPNPQRAAASFRRRLLFLIVLCAAVRVVFAASLGLGVDESYMVAAGRVLSLGYFDHPPASWWLSWGAAHLFATEAPIAVRLPFIALFALSTWLMARLGAAIADERAGFYAALLLNLSPVFSVTTGTWVLPDGPLDCALLGAALSLVHAVSEQSWRWWIGTGLCAGLALFSKYSAVLTIFGALVFLLTNREHRAWLRQPQPYAAGALALLVFAPVIVWNAMHGWASFAFQGDRAAGMQFHPFAFFVVLGGEAVFVLPWIWLPLMAVFIAALRRGSREWRSWLLACLAAPPIVLFALIAMWSRQRVLFHWAAPGYLMLFPLLGDAVARRIGQAQVRRTIIATAVFVLAGIAVVCTQIRLDWLHPVIAATARHDPDLEGFDWSSLRPELAARGWLQSGTIVGVPNWRDAGKIAIALGPDVTVLALSTDARQFGFAGPVQRYAGQDILVLAVDHPKRALQSLSHEFAQVRLLGTVSIRHAGREMGEVSVMRGTGLKG